MENAYTNVKLGSKRRTGVKQAPETSIIQLGREGVDKGLNNAVSWLKGGK